jgi:hypothetical protein
MRNEMNLIFAVPEHRPNPVTFDVLVPIAI